MTYHTPDEEWHSKITWINENRVELEIGGLGDGREKEVKENNQGKG
jgi:hypothetical protein